MNAPLPSKTVMGNDEASLVESLFRPMGVEGVYARSGAYEDVVEGLQRLFSTHRPRDAEVFRFPPVMSRRQLEASGYLDSFPQLLGCVCALHGSERDILAAASQAKSGGDWTSFANSTDLVLSPAACYPVYPIAARRGAVPAAGYVFDVAADCFRHEPSQNIDRLQSFRMREFVRVGAPEQILAFREEWIARASALADSLELSFKIDTANDPFFGRTGLLMAAAQREHALKFELLIPIRSQEQPTACMSFNYHKDHFGEVWKLAGADGAAAHTGCVAFGVDRLAVALFAAHGLEPRSWSATLRDLLGLNAG